MISTAAPELSTGSGLLAGAWIDVPYADTRSADLAFAIGLPALPAIRTRSLTLAGTRLELRILGSSHQVIAAGSALGELSETVACLTLEGESDTSGEPLPPHCERRLLTADGRAVRYRMESHVEPLADREGELLAVAGDLSHEPTGLVGVFPGHPLAFTGLRAAALEHGVRWETWHAYPQADELVRTRSRLERVAS